MSEKKVKPVKLKLRLPRSMQRQAARFAARDGVSLEDWLIAALAETLGANEAWEQVISVQQEAGDSHEQT